jgi:hypothetical protein
MLYKIADLSVKLDFSEKTLQEHIQKYNRIENGKADITIKIGSDALIKLREKYSYLTEDELEYIFTGFQFSNAILNYTGFCLHASALSLDQNAVLFSAPCGTGKSTHTGLWQQTFGKERLIILNDDKPVIRYINNKFYVYGTPWSGKSNLHEDIRVPLKAIVFLYQSETNQIITLSTRDAVPLLMKGSQRPQCDREKLNNLLSLHDRIIKNIPIYQLNCNISNDAVQLAYNEIFKGSLSY